LKKHESTCLQYWKAGVSNGISGLAVLREIELLVQPVDRELYQEHERAARDRIGVRDIDNWPVVALAILLVIPIWTEDQDFFGSGIAT